MPLVLESLSAQSLGWIFYRVGDVDTYFWDMELPAAGTGLSPFSLAQGP